MYNFTIPHLGFAYVLDGRFKEGLALIEEAVIAHCHDGLGRLYRQMGRKDQSQEHLAMATNMFREMEMNFWLEKAEKEKLQLS